MIGKPGKKIIFIYKVTRPDVQHDCQARAEGSFKLEGN